MKRILISSACALLLWSGATAQSNSYEIGGLMLRNDAMSTADFFSLSQTQFNFGTARSMGMAGAFTSLGADQTSMILNPAGLGMYRRAEITMTPLLTTTKASTALSSPYESNSKTRFALGNIGAVVKLYEGTNGLLSLNMGIGYNRLADYNFNYSFQYAGNNKTSSIADALSVQLEQGGLSINSNGEITQGYNSNYRTDPYFWNGVAAYKTYLVDRNSNGIWYPAEIGDNAVIDGGASVQSIGSAGEFDISMGGNWDNKLYFGFTLGIQSIYQRKNYYYGESYNYAEGNGYNSGDTAVDSAGKPLTKVMQAMGMTQSTIVDGVGVNFKAGITYRPTSAIRLGVALHTPTYYSLDRKYQTAMTTQSIGQTSNTNQSPHDYYSETTSDLLVDNGPNAWSFTSPTRLMFGASYTFGSLAVISVDYERDWYNGIRLQGGPYTPYGQDAADIKHDFQTYFKGSNMVRAGVEIRPTPRFALRAGFGYNGSMLKDKNTILSSPVVAQTTYYTAGIGFNIGRSAFIDVAYCYQMDQMTPYMLFYGNIYNQTHGDEIYQSEIYNTTLTHHNVALTLGFRF